mmetsp:Transcript_2307/g.5193  ORF Transcript_2307/g.5193 Transcript_2307/m.5193 type:complete len:374 (-) Transcript_2307:587-1708(-)
MEEEVWVEGGDEMRFEEVDELVFEGFEEEEEDSQGAEVVETPTSSAIFREFKLAGRESLKNTEQKQHKLAAPSRNHERQHAAAVGLTSAEIFQDASDDETESGGADEHDENGFGSEQNRKTVLYYCVSSPPPPPPTFNSTTGFRPCSFGDKLSASPPISFELRAESNASDSLTSPSSPLNAQLWSQPTSARVGFYGSRITSNATTTNGRCGPNSLTHFESSSKRATSDVYFETPKRFSRIHDSRLGELSSSWKPESLDCDAAATTSSPTKAKKRTNDNVGAAFVESAGGAMMIKRRSEERETGKSEERNGETVKVDATTRRKNGMVNWLVKARGGSVKVGGGSGGRKSGAADADGMQRSKTEKSGRKKKSLLV